MRRNGSKDPPEQYGNLKVEGRGPAENQTQSANPDHLVIAKDKDLKERLKREGYRKKGKVVAYLDGDSKVQVEWPNKALFGGKALRETVETEKVEIDTNPQEKHVNKIFGALRGHKDGVDQHQHQHLVIATDDELRARLKREGYRKKGVVVAYFDDDKVQVEWPNKALFGWESLRETVEIAKVQIDTNPAQKHVLKIFGALRETEKEGRPELKPSATLEMLAGPVDDLSPRTQQRLLKLQRKNSRKRSFVEEKPHVVRACIKKLVHSSFFGFLISIVIAANAIVIGLETDRVTLITDFEIMELAFLLFYASEIVLRFVADGRNCFEDNWFKFDLIVVLLTSFDAIGLDKLLPNSSNVAILRIMRLGKLVRLVRLVQFCQELSLLVTSMVSALKTVLWMWILLGLVIYMFAIAFCSELGHRFPDDESIQEWWGTVGRSCFTLFAILTLEGWVDVARHLWTLAPSMIFVILVFITLTTYAIVNVVAAVVVEHVVTEGVEKKAEDSRRLERDIERRIIALVALFSSEDADHDGCLSRKEYGIALQDDRFRSQLTALDIDDVELGKLFDQIDKDQDGILTIGEFVQGVMQLRGNARARRLFELRTDMAKNQNQTEEDMESLRCLLRQGFQDMQEQLHRGEKQVEKEHYVSWESRFDNLGAMVTHGFQSLQQSIDESREATGCRVPITTQDSNGDNGRMWSIEVGFRGLQQSIEDLREQVWTLGLLERQREYSDITGPGSYPDLPKPWFLPSSPIIVKDCETPEKQIRPATNAPPSSNVKDCKTPEEQIRPATKAPASSNVKGSRTRTSRTVPIGTRISTREASTTQAGLCEMQEQEHDIHELSKDKLNLAGTEWQQSSTFLDAIDANLPETGSTNVTRCACCGEPNCRISGCSCRGGKSHICKRVGQESDWTVYTSSINNQEFPCGSLQYRVRGAMRGENLLLHASKGDVRWQCRTDDERILQGDESSNTPTHAELAPADSTPLKLST